jgi:solute carrier family 26, other
MTNVIGANFSYLPNANALSRSIIQEQTGGKTQVAGVITAFLILIVLLWIGPFFEPLPKCVLAAIIVMALKGMLNQLLDLKNVVKEGVIETSIWVVTFVSVVLIDLDIGLLIGVVMSIGALYIKGWKSYYCLLGTYPDLGVYVDLATHQAAIEVPDVKIFRYAGSINFATRAAFKKALYKSLSDMQAMKVLIVDLSFVLHLDAAGCKCLADIRDTMNGLNIDFFLAGAADRVYDALLRGEAYAAGTFKIFSTVHDGVLFAHRRLVE